MIKIYTDAELNGMKVKELRVICAANEITRYSKANMATLIGMIKDKIKEDLLELTNAELKDICKDLGLSGYNKKTKAILIDMILNATKEAPTTTSVETPDTIDLSSDEIEIEDDDESDDGDYITVTCHAAERKIPFVEGKSIWDVHSEMMVELAIPAQPKFTVNGNRNVPMNSKLKAGDLLEFFGDNGDKG